MSDNSTPCAFDTMSSQIRASLPVDPDSDPQLRRMRKPLVFLFEFIYKSGLIDFRYPCVDRDDFLALFSIAIQHVKSRNIQAFDDARVAVCMWPWKRGMDAETADAEMLRQFERLLRLVLGYEHVDLHDSGVTGIFRRAMEAVKKDDWGARGKWKGRLERRWKGIWRLIEGWTWRGSVGEE